MNKIKDIYIDWLKIVFWLTYTVILVYFVGGILRDLFLLLPLLLFIFTKKKYFWLFYILVLLEPPAFLFISNTSDSIFRLPLYSFAPSLSFSLMDLILFAGIFSAILKRRKIKFNLLSPLKILLFYVIFVSIPISFVLETEVSVFLNNLRSFSYYGFIFIFLTLFELEDYYKFLALSIPFLFISLADQLITYFTGFPIVGLLDPFVLKLSMEESKDYFRILTTMSLVPFLAMTYGLILIFKPVTNQNKVLPVFIVIIFLLIVLISATRSWLVIFLMTILVIVIINAKGYFRNLVFILIGIILINQIGQIIFGEKNFFKMISRMNVLTNVIKEQKLEGADTYDDRLLNDIPKVFAGVDKSPVLGVGFSSLLQKHYSNDLGYQNAILFFGYIGFILFVYFLLRFIWKLTQFSQRRYMKSSRSSLIVLVGVFFGIFSGFLFTQDFFIMYPHKIMFSSFLFAFAEKLISTSNES